MESTLEAQMENSQVNTINESNSLESVTLKRMEIWASKEIEMSHQKILTVIPIYLDNFK